MNNKGRNSAENLSYFSQKSSRKKGSSEWTMKELLTIVLAVLLLVLIIYGVQNKGFGPLKQNIENRYNELLILLNIKDGGIPTCGDAFVQDIEGVGSGMFYPCENRCGFVITEPRELLDFTNFSVDKSGFSMTYFPMTLRAKNKAYETSSLESQLHRDKYLELNKIVDDFLKESGMSREDFIKNMGYNVNRDLTFYTDTSYFDFDLDKRYSYNGEGWVDKDGNSVSQDVVSEQFVDANKKHSVRYNYNELSYQKVSQEEFEKWISFKKVQWRAETGMGANGGQLYFYLEKIDGLGVFYYWNGLDKWYQAGTEKVDTHEVDEGFVFSQAYDFYADKDGYERSYWGYEKNPEKKYTFFSDIKVSGGRILEGTSSNDFENVFNNLIGEHQQSRDSYDNLIKQLNAYFSKDGEVARVGFYNFDSKNKFPMISINSNNGIFGVSYMGDKLVFSNNGVRSSVSDFVSLSDEDWNDFVKINKIYEYFKLRGCAQ